MNAGHNSEGLTEDDREDRMDLLEGERTQRGVTDRPVTRVSHVNRATDNTRQLRQRLQDSW
jgi:hypothetical protein